MHLGWREDPGNPESPWSYLISAERERINGNLFISLNHLRGKALDAAGAHLEFGGSTAYKFGRLFAVVLAYHLETDFNAVEGGWNYDFSIFPHERFSVGQLRRPVRLHFNHYLRNDSIDPATFRVGRGQTPDSASDTDEPYISVGSVYWSQNVFAALWLLDEADPLWSVAEEPLPSERGDFEQWLPVARFFLRNRTESAGYLEFMNVNNWIETSSSENFNRYINKYKRFSYSSRLGWATRSGTLLDHCLVINAGYTLGREIGENPLVQTGPDWTYRQSSKGAVFLQRLLGFGSLLTVSKNGGHSRDPAWTLPYALLPGGILEEMRGLGSSRNAFALAQRKRLES